MGKTYSIDLREKVVLYLSSGGCKKEASKIFNIGIATIYRWLGSEKAGNLSPKKRTSFYHVVDVDALREYVSLNPDHTLKEIGQALKIGNQTVCRWLKRLQITRKKRSRFTKKVMKSNVKNFVSS